MTARQSIHRLVAKEMRLSICSCTLKMASRTGHATLTAFQPKHWNYALVLLACIAFSGCGGTATMSAIAKGDRDAVATFIQSGGDVNKVQDGGRHYWSPLHQAAWSGQTEMVKLLLDNGARINAVSDQESKWTPLFLAVDNHHAQTVKVLLERGADTNMRSLPVVGVPFGRGDTPLELAQSRNYTDIIQLLQETRPEMRQPLIPSIPKEAPATELESPVGIDSPDRL